MRAKAAKMTVEKAIDSTKNYYEIIGKEFKQKQFDYPNYKYTNISLPSNMLIVGYTGSCKTNFLMNLIENCACFERFTLYAKNTDEPLYAYLIDCWEKVSKVVGYKVYDVYNDIDTVIPVKDYDVDIANLVIIDDQINEKKGKLAALGPLFTQGRKNNITTIFISQTYFDVPSIFRKNFQYIVITKVRNVLDLKRMLKDNSFDKSADELIAMYQYIRSQGDRNVLILDAKTNDPALRYRMNYAPLISQ
jgi:hypothetical protein